MPAQKHREILAEVRLRQPISPSLTDLFYKNGEGGLPELYDRLEYIKNRGVRFPPLHLSSKGLSVKNLCVLSLGLVAVLAFSGVASAEPTVKSGPQAGDSLGAFYVTKVAGAENDGVDQNANLCYRCRNGRRPQVIVFTRAADGKVAELVAKLDKAVEANSDTKLRVFVNVLGEDKADATEHAKSLATSTKAKNIPFVVPNEFENGPDNYGINAKAAITVTMASELGVKASHAAGSADDLDVASVLGDLKKILN